MNFSQIYLFSAALVIVVSANADESSFSDASADTAVRAETLIPIKKSKDWHLVWQDEFDASSLDLQKWGFERNCFGGGNNEQQCYTDRRQNLSIENGVLKITARHEAYSGPARQDDAPDYLESEKRELPFTSSRIRSKGKGEWRYGRFEIRAKLPEGQGTWPAIWMLPTESPYDWWAASGEIDIMEAVNLNTRSDESGELVNVPESRIHGTLHYGRRWPYNEHTGAGFKLPDGKHPADNFYTYAIEWQKDEIRWYVDDYHYATQKSSGWYSQSKNGESWDTHSEDAPFNHEFHLILNLAVGGNWSTNVNEKGIDETVFPQTLAIDYVRVYQCSLDKVTGKGCESIDLNAKWVKGKSPPDND